MWCSASSRARTFVSMPNPALALQYADDPSRGTCSWTLVTLTIRPPSPWRIIVRAARCAQRNGPSRSVATTRRQLSKSRSSAGSLTPVPPQFTSTPRPPILPESSSITSAASGEARSCWATAALCPRRSTSSAVARAPSSSVWKVMPTSKPSVASSWAVARPIPESAPVTIALRGCAPDMGPPCVVDAVQGRRTQIRRGQLIASARRTRKGRAMTDAAKQALHAALKENRAGMVAKLDGLGEYDVRRPLTPTATNLLGLVKHLAGVEYGYFGDSFG